MAGLFGRLFFGLTKSREQIAESMNCVFRSEEIDDDFYDELEEVLILADMGVETTEHIIDELKAEVKEKRLKSPAQCQTVLVDKIRAIMTENVADYSFEDEQTVILMVGVNGAGKTTTIGKLASQYISLGKKVMMVAGDTFRAAATEQLAVWAERTGADFIKGAEGQDPASVVYDASCAAKARHTDILMIDTAGRLQNKKNLMDELNKIDRVLGREFADTHRETWIVLDATCGQNALVQAREFKDTANVTGIVLTKMDGSAKGGIAVAIENELQIPVMYIGVGEKTEDLQPFDANAYVDALFGVERSYDEDVDA